MRGIAALFVRAGDSAHGVSPGLRSNRKLRLWGFVEVAPKLGSFSCVAATHHFRCGDAQRHFLTNVPSPFCPSWRHRRSAYRAWVPPIRRDPMPVVGTLAVRRLMRPVSRLSRRGGQIAGMFRHEKKSNFKARRGIRAIPRRVNFARRALRVPTDLKEKRDRNAVSVKIRMAARGVGTSTPVPDESHRRLWRSLFRREHLGRCCGV